MSVDQPTPSRTPRADAFEQQLRAEGTIASLGMDTSDPIALAVAGFKQGYRVGRLANPTVAEVQAAVDVDRFKEAVLDIQRKLIETKGQPGMASTHVISMRVHLRLLCHLALGDDSLDSESQVEG